MGKFIWFIVLTGLFVVFDFYVFQGLKSALTTSTPGLRRFVSIAFWSLTIITLIILGIGIFTERGSLPRWFYNYFMGIFVMLYFAKILVVTLLFGEDIWRGIRWIYGKASGSEKYDSSRSAFFGQLALVAGGTMAGTFIYGILRGAFNYNVIAQPITFPKLPNSFNGFKIVQISDLHVGSFASERPLEKAVELINAQKPDLVLFTGDLVNDRSTETKPFVETLSKIKATHGVYSVLGNHDYGDYVEWPSPDAKKENLNSLIQIQSEMGWKVLIDEHVKIEKDGAFISLIGIQNWGAKARFPKYGDLSKAYDNIESDSVKILMSHDPSHWGEEVIKKFQDIDLTLSGHTHGMQFGIEIPGVIKWSPVKYVYKEWAGLYKKGTQHLYVNRGLGFLGYPGRVGISPEITVFELNNA